MRDINNVSLVGRLVDVPNVIGESGCSFTLAVTGSKKVGESYEDEPYFFDCVQWGNAGIALAANAEKGQQVAITGYLKQEKWENEGQKRSKVAIVATHSQMLRKKGEK